LIARDHRVRTVTLGDLKVSPSDDQSVLSVRIVSRIRIGLIATCRDCIGDLTSRRGVNSDNKGEGFTDTTGHAADRPHAADVVIAALAGCGRHKRHLKRESVGNGDAGGI